MKELLQKIDHILQTHLFKDIDEVIKELVDINIPKENIRVCIINNKTQVSIIFPDVMQTIDISVDIENKERR